MDLAAPLERGEHSAPTRATLPLPKPERQRDRVRLAIAVRTRSAVPGPCQRPRCGESWLPGRLPSNLGRRTADPDPHGNPHKMPLMPREADLRVVEGDRPCKRLSRGSSWLRSILGGVRMCHEWWLRHMSDEGEASRHLWDEFDHTQPLGDPRWLTNSTR